MFAYTRTIMKTTTHKAAMSPILNLYDWHTRFLENVIDGISDDDAQNRMNTKANHVGWIAGSIVYERFALASLAGIDLLQTSGKLFENHQGIQDGVVYPSLAEYKKDWQRISPVLKEALINLSEEQLDSPDPFEMPGGPFTFLDAIVACLDRESYCIGQIGLYRRLLGYEAMKYQ